MCFWSYFRRLNTLVGSLVLKKIWLSANILFFYLVFIVCGHRSDLYLLSILFIHIIRLFCYTFVIYWDGYHAKLVFNFACAYLRYIIICTRHRHPFFFFLKILNYSPPPLICVLLFVKFYKIKSLFSILFFQVWCFY